MALGVSVFGGSAQAAVTQEASVQSCVHSTLKFDYKEFDHYEQASSEFHLKYYKAHYTCDDCGATIFAYPYEIEYHIFSGISENGKWCCGLCGEEDDYP